MKIIGVGRNYMDHAKELNNPVPKEPIIFQKPDSAILRNNNPFFYPEFSKDIHYEVEFVVKIDKIGKKISPRFAHRYYDEVALGIDFTARDIQKKCKEKGLPWEIAKGFDSSAPISKFVDKKQFENISDINFALDLNGQRVQNGNTKDMIFDIDTLISYISNYFTLKIGDLIFTGTPAGVGGVAIGDHLEGYLENEKMLDFFVK